MNCGGSHPMACARPPSTMSQAVATSRVMSFEPSCAAVGLMAPCDYVYMELCQGGGGGAKGVRRGERGCAIDLRGRMK